MKEYFKKLLTELYYLTHGHIVYNGVRYNLNSTNEYLLYLDEVKKFKDEQLGNENVKLRNELERYKECYNLLKKQNSETQSKNTFVDNIETENK